MPRRASWSRPHTAPRSAHAAALAAVLGLAASSLPACRDGCGDVDPIAPDTEQRDVFTQEATARVDVLWVVDNSASMAAEQGKVAERFSEFFRQLVQAGVDYHIGVVTSDPAEAGVLRAYQGPLVAGCSGCRFLTPAVPCDDVDVELADVLDDEAALEARLLEACPAQLVFRRLVRVGVDGSAFEEGFAQAARALGADEIDATSGLVVGRPPDENEGFLRADASLYVVFVSDEDEGAGPDGTPVRHFQRLFEALKGTGNENKVTVAAITGYPFDAALPPVADVCPVLETTFDGNAANDDPRGADLVEALRGPGGCTDVEGDPEDPLALARTGGRYIELACRTGGVVANMCERDYSGALDALGANAAGLRRKLPLSRQAADIDFGPDCVPFTGDDQRLDCDDDGSIRGANDGPLCVTAVPLEGNVAVLIPRHPVNGWDYEASTNSVRFPGGFVPAPGSTIEVRAFLRARGDRSCGP